MQSGHAPRNATVYAVAGQFLAGVAADEVTRIVVVVGSKGVRHGSRYLSTTASSTTAAPTTAWLDAYVGHRRVAHQDWLGLTCRKR